MWQTLIEECKNIFFLYFKNSLFLEQLRMSNSLLKKRSFHETFAEEIFYVKLHFLCSDTVNIRINMLFIYILFQV